MSDPFVPAVGTLWWVPTTILPPGDPERQRVVTVLSAPATTSGTLAVVVRSGDDDFARRVPVQCLLWTPANVTPAGTLDPSVFEALRTRFDL